LDDSKHSWLWWLTLPWFFAVYVFMQAFEGLLWLMESPRRAWQQIVEWIHG